MAFLRTLELLSGLLVVYFFVTQVTIPLFTGRILFPALRPARRRLEQQLAEQREAEDLDVLRQSIHPHGEEDNGKPESP